MLNRFEEIENEILIEPDEDPVVRERKDIIPKETDFLDPLDEAFLKNPKLLEEGFRAADEILERWETEAKTPLPERLRALLGFQAFNDVILGAEDIGKEPTLFSPKGFHKFEKLAEEELKAEDDPYLPTIGTEVEIPRSLPVYGNRLRLFEASKKLGIPKAGTPDEEWEFAVPYTYSAAAQNAYVHELIRGGYIETEEVTDGKRIKAGGKGTFPLHLNIEIPNEIIDRYPRDSDNLHKNPFDVSVTKLTQAFSIAFSSPERIEKKEYVYPVIWGRGGDISKPKRENHSGNERNPRKLELRSLEVRDKTLYRMLHEAQNLAAALFAHFRGTDEIELVLSKIWEQFDEKLSGLNVKYETTSFALDEDEKEQTRLLAETIRTTDLQNEMRALITEISLPIHRALNDARWIEEKEG